MRSTRQHVVAAPHQEVLVGRQPIVDRAGGVAGYELLYRSSDPGAQRPAGDQMTTHVALSALSLGLDLLAGDLLVFCNVGRGVVEGHVAIPLPPSHTVVEVPTPRQVGRAEVDGCRRLGDQGYAVGLDDFCWAPGIEHLLAGADYAKIDLLGTSREEAARLVALCQEHDVRTVAVKVESDETRAWAVGQGFDLIQGYVVERPRLVGIDEGRPSEDSRVQLATVLLTSDLARAELEWVLAHDAWLGEDLRRLAAIDPSGGFARTVANAETAIRMLGTVRSRQWACLLTLERRPGGDKEGLLRTLVRARMCEDVAALRGLPDAHLAFAASVLASLDLLAGLDEEDVRRTVDVDRTVAAAVLEPGAPLVTLAAEVQAHEEAGPVPADRVAELVDDLDVANAEAHRWATVHLAALGARVRRLRAV